MDVLEEFADYVYRRTGHSYPPAVLAGALAAVQRTPSSQPAALPPPAAPPASPPVKAFLSKESPRDALPVSEDDTALKPDAINESLWRECVAATRNGKPVRLPQEIGTVAGCKVLLVAGSKVKLEHYFDWIEGGNGWRYDFIPKDEFWLDAENDSANWPYVLYHEAWESRLMAQGLGYDAAHKRANGVERVLRMTYEGVRPAFPEKSGSYFGECPRDPQGHCLPSGQSGQPGGGGKKPPAAPAQDTSRGSLVHMRTLVTQGAAGDMNKAADMVYAAAQRHQDAGGKIVLHFEGKQIPVRMEGGRLRDAKGNQWGAGALAFDTPEHPAFVEFAPLGKDRLPPEAFGKLRDQLLGKKSEGPVNRLKALPSRQQRAKASKK